MFVLARSENGVIIFCEMEGEGTDVCNAYDFGSLKEAQRGQKSYKMYDRIYEVEIKYEVKNIYLSQND